MSNNTNNVQTEMLWELLSCTSDDIIGDLISMKGDEEVKANFPEDYAEWVTNNQTEQVDHEQSESEDEPEEISTCNCKPDWDIRCCCYPPMITRSFPATMTDGDIGWYKKDGHQDNWDNCPMKVGNAVWHYTNSRLSNDNRTKKGEYNLKYAKWVFGLMGLNQAQVKEAIDILKEQREED